MKRHNNSLRIIRLLLLLFPLSVFFSCGNKQYEPDLSMYDYQDTKNLVRFAFDASERVRKEGMEAIQYFKENRNLYNTKDFYLYIYDLEGKNLFHAAIPEFENSKLKEITDINGKKAINLVLEALQNKNNPHAWVHYSWWNPGSFYPVPKSACHFKIETPDGYSLFVGAGMDYPHEEKEFIRIAVDSAVDLLKDDPEDAIDKIKDPQSSFIYRDVRVFIIDESGEPVISPVLNISPVQVNFIECTDEAGHQPFKKALSELADQEATWQVFMTQHRDKRVLTKKVIYLRKTLYNNELIYVGAVTDLPSPAWSN